MPILKSVYRISGEIDRLIMLLCFVPLPRRVEERCSGTEEDRWPGTPEAVSLAVTRSAGHQYISALAGQPH